MEKMEIIGCYAQTELGHGSNVRGLEIEAVYDHKNKEFVMHSPSDSACKWWIGGLGNSSNHALLIAQLKINESSYGPHAFLVPIRDTETHEPLPGIEVGDIGPKIGLHTADNGYLKFHHYRIAKKYMLNRFSKINDKGEYEVLDPNSIKILYLSVVRARLGIIVDPWFGLASALTISIRYSISRQQFPDPENPKEEKKILDYQIQQNKLFKPLALLYSYVFMRVEVINIYLKAQKELESGNSESLAVAHCIICLYKVYVSYSLTLAVEICRRSCGGHGYLMVSGIPSLYTTSLAKVAYDGDNSILALQAIKYLVSLFNKNPPAIFKYIYGEKILPKGNPLSGEYQQQCFEAVAQYKVVKVYKKFLLLLKNYSKERIWNDFLQVEGIEATESVFYANIHLYYYENSRKIENLVNREAIEKLRLIFAASELEKYEGVLIHLGVNPEHLDFMRNEMVDSFKFIRKHALGLIEAFELSDDTLNSILGRKDGKIYQHLLAYAKYSNPINKQKVFPGINEHQPKL